MKPHKFLSVCVLLLLSVVLRGQQLQVSLSDSAFASLLTCSAGNDFYTTFGHSAIRVCDPAVGMDIVYNYGVFDFDTPHFSWKFACGNLNYCLARTSFEHLIWGYAEEGRSVQEQRLRLTSQELNNLFVLLETNYLPQYRYYRYDFFKDNCATRVRDIINGCLSHRTAFVPREVPQARTYRQLLRGYTENDLLWWQNGIDMLLGMRCDRKCNSMEYMFLPIELSCQLDSAQTVTLSEHGDSESLPISYGATTLLPASAQTNTEQCHPWTNPVIIFWGLMFLVLALSVMAGVWDWNISWLDVVLFVLMAVASLFILFFWIVSSYDCTKWNLNILWASPLFFYFAVRPNSSPLWLWIVQMVMLTAALIVGFTGVQSIPHIAYPIILTLYIRIVSKILNHRK